MADLIVDTDFLRKTGSDLRVVAKEFEHANSHSDDASDATGHDGLAERVREFAHNWDDRRKKMVGNIAGLAEAAHGVGDAFEQLETDLVGALEGK